MIELNESIHMESELSYSKILDMFSNSFLDQLFRISLIIALFNVYVFFYTRDIETMSWKEYVETKSTDRQMLSLMILKSGSLITLILSLFFPILIIGYKTGWYI